MEITLRQPYSFSQLGRRSNQEDARFPDVDVPQDVKAAFVVCDGVGGIDKGEVASSIAAQTIGHVMQRVDLSKPFTPAAFGSVLNAVYQAYSRASNPTNRGMATTITFVCFHSKGIFTAYIGDSRIYHVRPGVGILYQTEDHSLVNELVHSGNITPAEAVNHPHSNVITRCLTPLKPGQRQETASTFQIRDVEAGDYIFMCTDGVVHEVSDNMLVDILSSYASDREKMDRLAALSASSADNNTAYLIGVENVVYDDDDLPPAECSDADNPGSPTHPLEKRADTVVETPSSRRPKTLGAVISDFFDKLF